MLEQNCCLAGPHFLPLVEVLQDYVTIFHKLHPIVVDLWRPWKYNTARILGRFFSPFPVASHRDDEQEHKLWCYHKAVWWDVPTSP